MQELQEYDEMNLELNEDLEISSNEGNSSEPLFHSILNVVNSMKEATADKIHRRIQREGITQCSRPQVERALASALKYGIFQVRNNRYRVKDDVLDDEDTIYWQAQLKREETPYPQGLNNHGDNINPEKDRLRFRRLRISDNGCICRRNNKNKSTEGKGRQFKKVDRNSQKNTNSFQSSRGIRRFGYDQITTNQSKKWSGKQRKTREKRFSNPKISPPRQKEKEKKNLHRVLGDAKLKDFKEIKKVSKDNRINWNSREKCKRKRIATNFGSRRNASGPQSGRARNGRYKNRFGNKSKYNTRKRQLEQVHNNRNDVCCDESENEDEYYDTREAMTVSQSHQTADRCFDPVHVGYSKDSFMQIPSQKGTIFSSLNRDVYIKGTAIGSDITQNPSSSINTTDCNEIARHWKSSTSKPDENNLLDEWFGKPDWLGNRLQNAHNGTVKQFDKALKIEPLDSLPFRNIEETSYIT